MQLIGQETGLMIRQNGPPTLNLKFRFQSTQQTLTKRRMMALSSWKTKIFWDASMTCKSAITEMPKVTKVLGTIKNMDQAQLLADF